MPFRECVDVEEVPHPTVGFAENDHGVHFLSDGSFRTIGSQTSLRQIKQSRVDQPFGFRNDSVPNADVDLHLDPSVAEACLNRRAQAPIGVFLPNGQDFDG